VLVPLATSARAFHLLFSNWAAIGACHPPAFLWPRYSYEQVFARFLNDQSGATAIEYGLIAAGISIAIITVVNGLGTNLNNKFTSINSSLK
jgi:pilus assembly protein Flp/PilA